ncbi:TonB family protein [Teichococcus vastitatis]|uniref:TonB family protein n=1 Tax=Teichococcus vastitatis TaxID=2307076 RepID=UPI001300206C|nr:TonB family protein [Pseudoroseomonas vastitatis]
MSAAASMGQSLPRMRTLGWGVSVLLHGGAAAFLLVGLPAEPPPSAVVVPLEMTSMPTAPTDGESTASDAAEPVQAVAPETVPAEPPPVAAEAPPELAPEAPPDIAPVQPPDPVLAEVPPEPAPAPPELAQAVEPETAPLLETEVPPPPPPAPPPPPRPVQPPPRTVPPRPVARPAPAEATPRPDPAPRPAASAAQAAAPAQPGRLAAPPPSYISRLNAALVRAKRYPNGARIRRQEGTAILSFRMDRQGEVLGWRIVRSTGFDDLDSAVGEMIERASPLPPPPEEVPGNPVELQVPVNFSLR